MPANQSNLRILFLIFFTLGSGSLVSRAEETTLLAGAAAVDISPQKLPVIVNGGMLERTADRIVDRLHVRTLVLEQGKTKLVISVVDSCMVPRELLDEAKEIAHKATGIPTENMLISSTHTHSAPSVFACLGSRADEPYSAFLPPQIAKSIILAHENRQPARIGWGVGQDPANVFIRRWRMKPGTAQTNRFSGKENDVAQMNPGHENENKIEKLGVPDTDVSVLAVQSAGGRPIALLGNYSTHYAGAPSLSADYFGVFCRLVEKELGHNDAAQPAFVALMTNGTSGDANCYDYARKSRREYTHETVGRDVAEVALSVYKKIEFKENPPLVMQESKLELKVRLPTEKEVAAATEFLAPLKNRIPQTIEEVYAQETIILNQLPPTRELKLQAIRIGDLGIAAIPNEVFSSTGLAIKKESPLKTTFSIELANGCFGYIPPPDQHELGGYTTWRARSSCLEEQAEPKIRAEILRLLTAAAAGEKDAALGNSSQGPLSPKEALQSFTYPADLKLELVAAEPLVEDPVAFDWGDDGKLWVAEMHDYPLGVEGKPGGRVRFLEDTTGDGRYDRSTLFADDLLFPNGICAWRKGVLVTSAPHVLYLEDTNGDGKADHREVLYSGFTEGNPQLRINGLRWGLDNWLYLANGLSSSGSVKSVKTGQEIDIRGRDLRIFPDLGLLEAESGPSQFGRNRDAYGNWFGVSNANPLFHFVISDRYIRRNPHFAPPSLLHDVSTTPRQSPVYARSRPGKFFHESQAGKFTSANSAMIYRDNFLGEAYAGNSFVSEPVHNLIHREEVWGEGVTFASRRPKGEEQSEFLASTDPWFRPATIRDGPDGALYFADMVRETIEHPQWIPPEKILQLNLRAGSDRGRIYRLVPQGRQLPKIPRLDELEPAELASLLQSPSGTLRDMAQRRIVLHKLSEASPKLIELATEGKEPVCRMQALCTLAGLESLTDELLLRSLQDEHPAVRRQAVLLAESRCHQNLELARGMILLASQEQDFSVRLQLALSLGCIENDSAAAALCQLVAGNSPNQYLLAAATSSLHEANIEAVIRETIRPADKNPLSAGWLCALAVTSVGLGKTEAALRLLKEVCASPGAEAEEATFQAFASLLNAFDQKQLSIDIVTSHDDAAAQAVRHTFELARKAVRADTPLPLRLAAVQLLGRDSPNVQEDLKLLQQLLGPRSPPEIQSAVVQAIVRTGGNRTVDILLSNWKSLGPKVRSEIGNMLLSRPSWTSELLNQLEARQLAVGEIDAATRQMLLTHSTAAIRSRAELLFQAKIVSDRNQLVQEFQQQTSGLKPDASAGALVFKEKCSACHKLGDIGQAVGPDLSGLTDKSPAALLVALLDPNRAIDSRYLSYAVALEDGRVFNGILQAESANSLILVDAAGKEHTLLRREIEEISSTGKSLMPEGLERDLSPQQLTDVMGFLAAFSEQD